MTCIADERIRSKAKLKVYAADLNAEMNRGPLYIFRDPSLFNPKAGGSPFTLSQIAEGEEIVVTNHPKRSWFAQVGRKGGKLYVK